MDTLSQMMNAYNDLNVKDIEITTLKLLNEQLQNDLRREKEIVESFNKPNEAIEYFEKLLKYPRFKNDTSGLGYTNIEEGESCKTAKETSDKGKDSKPTCHFCGKKGHTANVCRSRMSIGTTNLKLWVIVISAIRKDIRHMNARLEPSGY